MIKPEISAEISRRLAQVEQQHQVRILLAVESGSRAWGFASVNSDYDVRFIYAHPKDWYVAVDLEEKRDVIEYPIVDEIDLNGWDVRKALRLLWRSNPTIVEWLQSPIVYRDSGPFASAARALLPAIYSPAKGIFHYRSMAKTNYRTYLRSEQVPLKKYFYVLRPLLAVRWLERFDVPAPIEFGRLLEVLDDARLLTRIQQLVADKQNATEKTLIPAIPDMNKFIERELDRLENYRAGDEPRSAGIEQLNELFHQALGGQD